MKKILLTCVLVSSFAMSGNLENCSHAIEKMNMYDDSWWELAGRMAKLRKEGDEYKESLQKTRVYQDLEERWKKRALIECKGILNEITFEGLKKRK